MLLLVFVGFVVTSPHFMGIFIDFYNFFLFFFSFLVKCQIITSEDALDKKQSALEVEHSKKKKKSRNLISYSNKPLSII